MKHVKLLAFILFSMILFFSACKDKTKTLPTKTTTPKPVAIEPPQNASGVWHYICSKRCAGGSGAAGNCTNCGSPLLHNALYHGNANTAPTVAPTSGAPFANPPAAAPSQNAAGVFHYTCSNGCAGGSGTAGNCATCGGALAHNQAYH
ncbi:hypothetical protein UMM65_17050 [Aureibaculum sp. 2210JD6-5]|uniref:hypothetical protein n=1 Tax=Aureibaculum sp. 2210JD6-5 TaxID=3103957 RepID=UPI002AAEB1F4|nr:hypothetical protein [Aureibaculum sp. 2210JD6-5]MDY7396957.1 hypothetical protein [Aureibaculum sp. 2210JD6-5]